MKRCKHSILQRIGSIFLSLAVLISILPIWAISSYAATEPLIREEGSKITDTSTVNDWHNLFPDNSSENAGSIWLDKSVFKTSQEFLSATEESEDYIPALEDEDNSFLVALSGIASNKEVVGYSTTPTDTILLLDLSSSMQGANLNSIRPLAEATNNAIKELLALNKNNRVGVVIYSGSYENSGTLPTRILMPLDRYTTTDPEGDFVEYKLINGEKGIAVVNGVRNSNNQTNFGLANNQSIWSSGTFTQDGIYVATNMFMEADQYIEDGNIQASKERLPIMVLMSDGEPSLVSTDYAQGTQKSDGLKHLTSDFTRGTYHTGSDTDFMVQLTAAYAKYRIEQKYQERDMLFYSLGLQGNSNYGFDSILDPANNTATDEYWTRYLDDNRFRNWTIRNSRANNQYSITTSEETRAELKAAVTSTNSEDLRPNGLNKYRYYIDKYFRATDDSVLVSSFKEIVDEIKLQSRYYPTYVDKSTNIVRDGYVTLVDTIGENMELKKLICIQSEGMPFFGSYASQSLIRMLGESDPGTTSKGLYDILASMFGNNTERILDLIEASVNSGNLYYNSDTDFSNAICWYGNYADAVEGAEYKGIWDGVSLSGAPEGANAAIKSYLFYEQINSRIQYVSVDVVTYLDTGSTKIRVKVPAALVPIRTYEVELDGSTLDSDVRKIKLSGSKFPVRLLYEVGLKEEINSLNVGELAPEALNPTTGQYDFYTNKWDWVDMIDIGVTKPRTVGHSYAFFAPSDENEYMYYQYDTPIYQKTGDSYTQYIGNSAPEGDNIYTEFYYYTALQGASTTPASRGFRHVHHSNLVYATKADGNTWVIPRGTPVQYEGDAVIVYKDGQTAETANGGPTGTYKTAKTYIMNQTNAGRETEEVALGNNGKLSIEALQGIRLQKIVPQNSGIEDLEDTLFGFTITPEQGVSLSGSYDVYFVDGIDNTGAAGATEATPVTASGNSITINLNANQTAYIAGLPAGEYTVTEAIDSSYVVSEINGQASSSNAIAIEVQSDKFQDASFTNIARGSGRLTISKEVVHNYGSGYVIPDNISFNMTATLTFNGEPLANETFEAIHSGDSEATQITTDSDGKFTTTLKHLEALTLSDVPEGTEVVVVEAQTENFTPSYIANGIMDEPDASKGQVTVEGNRTASVLVRNQYKEPQDPVDLSINVGVEKTLTANADFTGSFEFELQAYNGGSDYNSPSSWDTLDTKSVSYAGESGGVKNVSFDDVFNETYTEVGTYIYRIIEEMPAVDGIEYDTHIHSFHVNVTDVDMDGKLEVNTENGVQTNRPECVTITPPTSGATSISWNIEASFNNSYEEEQVAQLEILVQKAVNNPSGSPVGNMLSGFKFELWEKDGTAAIEQLETNERGVARFNLSYREADVGTYDYIIKEIPPSGYTQGEPWTYDLTEHEVSVYVGMEDDILTAEFTNPALNDIPPTDQISQVVLNVTNGYNPDIAELSLDVNKTLVGRDMRADEFSFELVPADNNSPILNSNGNAVAEGKLVATNAAAEESTSSDVIFPKLYFNKVGNYNYTLRETSTDGNGITTDKNSYRVSVNVTDNNGKLVATYSDGVVGTLDMEVASATGIDFVNRYTFEPGAYAISGTKKLTGRDLRNGEFSFLLTEAIDAQGNVEENPKTYTASNNVNEGSKNTGTFTFPAITYTAPGTYYYLVTEQTGTEGNGVAYSNQSYVVTVNVTDSGNGPLNIEASHNAEQIHFENSYEPAPTATSLAGSKSLRGNRRLLANDFEFELYRTGSDYTCGATPEQQVRNNAAGHFSFDNIELDRAGTHYFVIKEKIPTTGIKGVTYDEAWYKASIVVTDGVHGHLTASQPSLIRVSSDAESEAVAVAFYNSYKSDRATLGLGGVKELEGRTLLANEFEFKLQETDESFEPKADGISLTAKNAADGTFHFEDLTYEEEGTFYYVISEDDTNKLSRVRYDDSKFYITVNVTEDVDQGSMIASPIISTSKSGDEPINEVIFANEYTPKPSDITLDIDITKIIESMDENTISPEGFLFALVRNDLVKPSYVKSDKNGKAKFTLGFTEDDIGKSYDYTLSEASDGRTGVIYSTEYYKFTISIDRNNDNELVATIVQDDEVINNIKAQFVNRYDHSIVLEEEGDDDKGISTGDAENILTWLWLLFVSGVGVLYGLLRSRNRIMKHR